MKIAFGIEDGGFCSKKYEEEPGKRFNSRELTKLDIECAKLAETRLKGSLQSSDVFLFPFLSHF